MAKVTSAKLEVSSDFNQRIETFAKSISKQIAVEARQELVSGYQQILNDFYNDGWVPTWYRRTDQLRTKSFVGVLDAGHPYRAFGGISLAPERLHYKKMGASFSTEDIIDDFLESSHGGWVQSPINVWNRVVFLLERVATKVSHGKVFDEIVARAKIDAGL